MMTLDEKVLAEAREVRQRLVDLESQTAHARVDYHHAIKKLSIALCHCASKESTS